MRKTISGIWLAVFALCLAPIASGQVPTGTPPFSTSGGGPADVLDLANLNAHIAIPAVIKAGRGRPFYYILSYDTSVWYPTLVNGVNTWQPVNNWGWRAQTEVAVGYISRKFHSSTCGNVNPPPNNIKTTYIDTYVYHDTFGISHQFNITWWPAACTQGGAVSGLATDGSGWTLSIDDGGRATLTSRAGDIASVPYDNGIGAASKADSNGNYVSVSSTGVFTDTLGTTVLSVSGGAPSPLTFTYTGPSGNVSYTVNYTGYNVKTNFGCSGVGEYTSTSTVYLVSSIKLPDQSQYSFSYEQTPNNSSYVTGRLASVTLPTGGTIQYTYTGSNNGIMCADGSAAGLKRQTPDQTSSDPWIYSRSGTPPSTTTTVTDPQGNQTVLNFSGIYETQRKVYQGSSTLLLTLLNCYNGNFTNCATATISTPTRKDAYRILPNNKTSLSETYYNGYGLLTEDKEYDFGVTTGSPPSSTYLVRDTVLSYANLGNSIVDRPSQVTVKDGSGNVKAQTTYTYDEGSVTGTSGTPQHNSVNGSRGNPTTVSSLVAGSTTLSRHATYYDTGTLNTATDVNGAVTTYKYGSGTSCGNSFITEIDFPLSLVRDMTWDCNGGVITLVTDENGQKTTLNFVGDGADPFWRPETVTDPLGNTVVYDHQPNSAYLLPFMNEASMTFGSSISDHVVYKDGLGRPLYSQIREAPGSSTFDTVTYTYDSIGRLSSVSMPCAVAVNKGCPSTPATTTTYDGLNRPLVITDGGGGTLTRTYSANDVFVVLGPAPAGENAKQKQYEYDGLGRLTSVCEISSASGSGTCGQTNAMTGFWTKYSYDALGRLTNVTQNAQGTAQTRSFAYDGLSRMTSETNPENGQTQYFYDSAPTTPGVACSGPFNGGLVKRYDANGNTTCYQLDALHRVTSVTYSGPNAASTPTKTFVYDAATVNGVAMAHAKGRLAEAYTGSKVTDEGFSYSVRGELTDVYQSAPSSGGYYHTSVTFWANGALETLGGLSAVPSFTFGLDGEGRISTVTAGSGQNPVSATSYNAASQATSVTLGSADSDSFTFDPNTGRMTQYKATINGSSAYGSLTWNPNGTLRQLSVTDPFNSGDNNQTCNFGTSSAAGYDDLGRLVSANCGSVWGQTFSYDPFGNITKSGSISWMPGYNSSTNRYTLSGTSYDASGDLLNDTFHAYTWDVEGHPVSIDSSTITYNAFGSVVEMNNSGAKTDIVYTPTGRRFAYYSNGSFVGFSLDIPGGLRAGGQTSGAGVQNYSHPDWLGTQRLISSSARQWTGSEAFAPFGEPYAKSGQMQELFTNQYNDEANDLYDFPFRETHRTQGRWISPDPAGLAAVDPTNPQSWNRYAYAMNSPHNFIDPLGLRFCPLNENGDSPCGSGDSGATIDGWSAPLSMAMAVGNGGFGYFCYGNCALFDNGQLRVGADNNIYGQQYGWVPYTDASGVTAPNIPLCGACQQGVGGGYSITAQLGNLIAYWGVVGTVADLGSPDCELLCGVEGTAVFNRIYPRNPREASTSPVAPATQAQIEAACTIVAINQNNGFGAGAGDSATSSVTNGIVFQQYTQYPRPTTMNPSAPNVNALMPLAAPGIFVQGSYYNCLSQY